MNAAPVQTILCVDDDGQNLELLKAHLSPQGYKLQFAGSGNDALKQIEREMPDLILLDVMMPGMSGMEVLERLRAEERTRSIPVAFLTAMKTEEDRIKGIGVGCDDFISKPFNRVELIARVRSLLKISLDPEVSGKNERLWRHIAEMSQPMIVCGPDWIIMNLNPGAQRYLMPGQGFGNVNFLEFIFKNYSVSVSRTLLSNYAMAPQTFQIEKKNSVGVVVQRAEVALEIFEDPTRGICDIVLTLRDVLGEAK